VHRYHPSNWPLALWVAISIGAELLRVQYTLGAFSFAPAVALLSGTWLGWRRAGAVQAAAMVGAVAVAALVPELGNVGDWGFRLGLIAAAMLAGVIARPDGNGAHPVRAVRLAVFGAAGATAGLVLIVIPRQSSGVLFALTFLLATSIAVFYAYRMVPEPGRVIGYAFCLLPYYAAGIAWNLIVARLLPARAALAGIPDDWDEILFHAYFAHLPSELIAVVVIAYLVCALDRGGSSSGPMAVGASR
jgi:hypothetical protein